MLYLTYYVCRLINKGVWTPFIYSYLYIYIFNIFTNNNAIFNRLQNSVNGGDIGAKLMCTSRYTLTRRRSCFVTILESPVWYRDLPADISYTVLQTILQRTLYTVCTLEYNGRFGTRLFDITMWKWLYILLARCRILIDPYIDKFL